MEILFKSVLSIALVGFCIVGLRWIWTHQLDLKGTFEKVKESTVAPPEWIATRESDGIYQGGQLVGKVVGQTEENEGKLHISRLINATNLNRNEIFEYQRLKLRFLRFKSYSGTEMGPRGVFNGVYEGVICEIQK